MERLWDAVLDGTADCLISDHSAYTLAEKEPGWDNIFDAPLGCQVIQETVPLVLDEAYHRRGMPLDAFVRFSSTNAARIAGLYPRKGSLLPGADADLALYDLEGEWVVDAKSQQFSKNPWSPFDGRRVRARVVRTVVRGETVYADGEIVAEPGFGRVPVVPRRLLPGRAPRAGGERRMTDVFRLALLNPNTDARHTEAMAEVARETLPAGCEVTAVSPERGPTSIESEADAVVAAAEVAALVSRAARPRRAISFACFGDPGVGAARELTEAPGCGDRRGGLPGGRDDRPPLRRHHDAQRGASPSSRTCSTRHGVRSRCVAVEPLDIPVADQGSHHPDTTAAIVAAGRRVVAGARRRGARPGVRRHGGRRARPSGATSACPSATASRSAP